MKKLIISVIVFAFAFAVHTANAKSLNGIIKNSVLEGFKNSSTVVVDHGELKPPTPVEPLPAQPDDVWLPAKKNTDINNKLGTYIGTQYVMAIYTVGDYTYCVTSDNSALFEGGQNYLLEIVNGSVIRSLVLQGIGYSIVISDDGTTAYIGCGEGGKKDNRPGLAIVDLATFKLLSFFEVPWGDWSAPRNIRILEVNEKEIFISYLFTSQKDDGTFKVDAVIGVADPTNPQKR